MSRRVVDAQQPGRNPLATAKLRGAKEKQRLLEAGGGLLSAKEAAELLGISIRALDKRRKQEQLIGLLQGREGYAYPAWQFEGGRTIEDLEQVLEALREHDPLMQMAFFLNENDRLGGKSPLDVLRSGHAESVLWAAAEYGNQGAA